MKRPYTMSGKRGHTVWQRNRYGQISYPAFIPLNPRTAAQQAVRANFRAVSKRWPLLTQPQRNIWDAVAWNILSKPRLFQCGRLTGCQLFVKINVTRVHRGQPQLDLPPLSLRCPNQAVPSPLPQPPVGPMLFLQAHWLLARWPRDSHPVTALLPAPT